MRHVLYTILLFSTMMAQAQGFRVRHYLPQTSNNTPKALYEISPGKYIGAGFVMDTSQGQARNCIAIAGLDEQGQLLWQKRYTGQHLSYYTNGFIQRCFYKKDNFLYYAGCARDTNGANIGVFLKFNLQGDTLWQRTYREPLLSVDLIPQMLTASVDNGFLITGFFQDWTNHTQEGLILKTDAQGQELWRKKISKAAPNVQDGKAIVQDSASKKIAIVGYQYLVSNDTRDNVLILDSLGNKVYQGTLCWSGVGGMGTDLIQTKDKKLVMVGCQYYPQTLGGMNTSKSFMVKFDINNPGNPIWKVDGFDLLGLTNYFANVIELQDGSLLVSGALDSLQGVWNGSNNKPSNILTRLTIVRDDGQIKWNRYYDYKSNNSSVENYQGIRSINLCTDGSWLASIEGFNFPGNNPFLFVKYDSTGCDSSLAYCANLAPAGDPPLPQPGGRPGEHGL
jgi:hypothetical protein